MFYDSGVLIKLVMFALSLAFIPIATYFCTQKFFFQGVLLAVSHLNAWADILRFSDNPTFAAIAAVFAANVILVAYIVRSVAEDRSSLTNVKKPGETKKEQ